jgi:CHASE2 domain-containing sensor protein
MQYHNFDLWIDEKDKASIEYHLRANIETFDSASGLMHLDPTSDEVTEILERFARRETDHRFLTAAGELLFKAVFQPGDNRIYDLFQQCLGRFLPTANDGIRLRLRIEAPEVAALPWEYIYLSSRGVFLSTWTSTPLVRYLDVGRPVPKLEMSPPVKMLVVIPANSDLPTLDTTEEKNVLLKALKDMQSYVRPTFLEGNVSLDGIEEALNNDEFHVLHFIGHGDFDGDEGILWLTAQKVNQEQLGQLFQNLEHMKLVVLNACKGAQVSPTKPFLGIAPQLVRQGVPAVVAMQYSIYDDVAVHFSRRFYQSLIKGKCCGKVDLALTQARNSLRVHYPQERAFGAPVLFMRSPRGVLFHRSLPQTILEILRKIPHLLATNEGHRVEEAAHTYSYNKSAIENSDLDPQTKTALIQDAEDRIKQIYRLLKYQSLAAVALVAFVLFCMSCVSFLDLFHLDTTMESCTMALGDHFAVKQFSDEIVMIPIDEDTEKNLGRPYEEPWAPWREDHAVLVEHLSEAGAKVVAFDISFSGPSERRSDLALRDAILRAQKRGTSVIVGVHKLDQGQPDLLSELRTATIAWGIGTIGERGYTKLIPLSIYKAQAEEHVVGLALRAFAAYNGVHKVEIVDFDRNEDQISVRLDPETQQVRKLGFFETDVIDERRSGSGFFEKGDTLANLAVDLTRITRIGIESQRYCYEDIRNAADPNKLGQLTGKIAIVGVGIKRFDDLYGGRWGLGIQADAINTLMNGVTIRSVKPGEQFVLMVVLGILGAAIRTHTRHVSRRWGISLLIAVLVLYFAGTIYLYTQYRLLLNTIYHVISLFLTYWVVGRLERRYFQ